MCVVFFVVIASSNHHHYYDHDDDHHYHHRSVERDFYGVYVLWCIGFQSNDLRLGPLRGIYYYTHVYWKFRECYFDM